MKQYKIDIHKDALLDLKNAAQWYDKKQVGLGKKFVKQVKMQINTLKITPLGFTIRYATVRCMVIKTFPFMVHFTVNEKRLLVEILAIFHTSRNPEIWKRNEG